MFGGKQLRAYVGGGAAGAAQLTTSGTTIHTFTMGNRCRPICAKFIVTTQVTITAPVINFTSGGGSTGDCGKLTVAINTAAGYGTYEETDYNTDGDGRWVSSLRSGQQVAVVVATTSTAGAGIPILIVEEDPDVPENETRFTKTVNV